MEKKGLLYSNLRVLVIDNNSVISECLERSGFNVTHIAEPGIDIASSIAESDVVVNNLPFISDMPFMIGRICAQCGTYVIYPMQFGWGIVLTILRPGGDRIERLSNDYKEFYDIVAQRAIEYGQFVRTPYHWLESYLTTNNIKSVVATDYLAAAMCANLISRLAEERDIKFFPKFYITTLDA